MIEDTLLVGKQIGKLTVLHRVADKRKGGYFECLCSCGNLTIVAASSLYSKKTKSCGCLRHQFMDITNHKFGRLTALKLLPIRGKGRIWECRCDCGNSANVCLASLRSGNTKSCGCLQKEKASRLNFVDMTGKQFGRITVIGIAQTTVESGNSSCSWNCICSCGRKKIINGAALRSGMTVSCGCYNQEIVQMQAAERRIHPDINLGLSQFYSRYKHTAARRKIPFELDIVTFEALVSSSCHYCATPPPPRNFSKAGDIVYSCNGIDRINNSKGYTIENSTTCCSLCNSMKLTQTAGEFIERCRKISNKLSPYYQSYTPTTLVQATSQLIPI